MASDRQIEIIHAHEKSTFWYVYDHVKMYYDDYYMYLCVCSKF